MEISKDTLKQLQNHFRKESQRYLNVSQSGSIPYGQSSEFYFAKHQAFEEAAIKLECALNNEVEK